MEGIMFRSSAYIVMSVRQTDGRIVTHSEEISSLSERYRFLKLPFIRGVISLFETLYLGMKGLYFSGNAILDEEEQITIKEFTISIVMALVLASFFLIVPFLFTTLLNLTGIVFNIFEVLLRLTIYLLFFVSLSRWKEYRRILQYHGAEHKTVNAHEARAILEIATLQKFPRLHPRCGTSFIFITTLVSILLFSIIPNRGFAVRLAYRILLIPVIGSISYELLKFSDRYKDLPVTRILTIPGLFLQHLTTREPDDEMLEVALEAINEITRLQVQSKG